MSWLRDLDRLALALMTGVLLLRSISQMFYALFLGLNQAARWGMGQVIREWVTLAFIIPGVRLAGLRGAGLALLVAETVVLTTVLAWARPHLRGLRLSLNVSTYLRFGLLFFASDALWTAFQYSGEPLVRALLSNYAQVGYFGLAYNIYLTAVAAIAQLAHSFLAQLTALLAQGQTLVLQEWIERLLKWLAIGGVLVVLGTLFLGEEAVALVFGAAYRPVAVNLIPLALALFALTLGSTAQMLAAVYEKPETALQASGVRLAAFWALGIPLIAWQSSLGGCIAVLAATAAHAAYFTWRMRRAAPPYSLRQWALAIGLGLVLLPLAWLRSSWVVNTVLCAAAVFGYGGLLWLLRVVTPREVVALWQAVRPSGRAISPIG
jgi:O-antigen/teichoic acid export membrane protein